MNLLTGNIRQAYFRYLSAAFGSALISSIYYLVDMAMVGQYQGPDGHGGAGRGGSSLEYCLQPWPLDRHWRCSAAQYSQGKRPEPARQRVFHRRCGGKRVFCPTQLDRNWDLGRRLCCASLVQTMRCCRWRRRICGLFGWLCRCFCSIKPWRRFCAMTITRPCHGSRTCGRYL